MFTAKNIIKSRVTTRILRANFAIMTLQGKEQTSLATRMEPAEMARILSRQRRTSNLAKGSQILLLKRLQSSCFLGELLPQHARMHLQLHSDVCGD